MHLSTACRAKAVPLALGQRCQREGGLGKDESGAGSCVTGGWAGSTCEEDIARRL
jgi:hypothetical protein